MNEKITTIIFDLGAVLIDWNPKYVFSKIFNTEEKMNWFFENICTSEWNEKQDAGRSLQEATEELIQAYPEYEHEVRAYYGRWEEMLGGAIEGTVDILRQLKQSGKYKLYALTNWSAETFPVAIQRYDFLQWFDGIVMSGEERTRKPFADIYNTLLTRFNVRAGEALFIDDSLRNIHGAEQVGIRGIHFHAPGQLRQALNELGIELALR
jgi:2-haloacid dehalogenase